LLFEVISLVSYSVNSDLILHVPLALPRWWPGTKTKREVWLLRTWFGIVPVNKQVSLMWLLWVPRSF